jgi:hypothetical protein
MKKPWFTRFVWWFWIYFFRILGLPFHLSPLRLPRNEVRKLQDAASSQDVLVIFNPGGWGDVPIEQAGDFAPILEGVEQTLANQGYRAATVLYVRTLPGLIGRMAGIRQQLNSFKHSSQILAKDVQYLADCFPEKRFLLAGFSTGGGLTGRTMPGLDSIPNVYCMTVGVPGWFNTYSSQKSLVLNNSGRDPLCSGDSNAIAMAVLKAPLKWLMARINRRRLSWALAIQISHHEYCWSSPEVGTQVVQFLEKNFKRP